MNYDSDQQAFGHRSTLVELPEEIVQRPEFTWSETDAHAVAVALLHPTNDEAIRRFARKRLRGDETGAYEVASMTRESFVQRFLPPRDPNDKETPRPPVRKTLFDPAAKSFPAWLFGSHLRTIVTRYIRSHGRRWANLREADNTPGPTDAPAFIALDAIQQALSVVYEWYVKNKTVRQTEWLVRRMRPILLRHIYGLRNGEIAEKLQMSEEQVAKNCSLAGNYIASAIVRTGRSLEEFF